MSTTFLKTLGGKIVDGDGNQLLLKGAAIGGWMNMEASLPSRLHHTQYQWLT
jgi:hypothetical protein